MNEITWKRTLAHGSALRFGPVHDTILLYAKTDQYLWGDPRIGYDADYVQKKFTQADSDRGPTLSSNFANRRRCQAGDVPFAAEVGESGRLLCTPILSSDVATFLRGAGRDELMKRVGQRGHLAKPAHATKLLFCLEDR